MCGTISPTKPMSPATDTAAAVSSDAEASVSSLKRSTDSPRCPARSSPSSMRLSSRVVSSGRMMPATNIGRTIRT